MNMKELEALVIAQGEKLQEQAEAHMHLVQRADNIVEGFKQELAARDERLSELRDHQDGMNDTIAGLQTKLEAMSAEEAEYISRIETLEKLVLARNASAATKRNMTDEDATRVLTGDLKGLSHKEAAEKAGLTYAQVYSCRLEFTFKHVHKAMRDAATPEAPWKNAWAK